MIRGPLINWNLQVPHKVDIKDNYKQEQIAVIIPRMMVKYMLANCT